jgi:glycosyltransferase involved in cell wall biosynthesis
MVDFLTFMERPVICHAHEMSGAIREIGVDNIEIMKRYDARYIAVSAAVQRDLVEYYGISAKNVQLIHGFIPVPDRPPEVSTQCVQSIRQQLAIEADAPLVIGCGSIERRKGTDLFLDTAKQVLKRLSPAHFLWMGGTPESVAEMRRIAAASNLSRFVHFPGSKPNVAAYFAAADLFLLTSREDPFPLVVMEAALYGIPIVCFEGSGGASEFVEDDAGCSIPDFDTTLMSDTIIKLILSPEERRQKGAAAQQKVMTHFNLPVGATKIKDLITAAMPDSGARRSW